MATVSELTVKINAKNDGLKRSLDRSKSRIGRFASNAKRKLKTVGKVLAASFAAAAVAIGASFRGVATEIDRIAKTSAKLGVGIKALQELQLAAQLSGVPIKTFNMAIQRMVRRVSEAARGSGEAKDAIKELGLNAKELAKLSIDKQFALISKAFSDIGSQGDKVRLAMRLFDSEGVALVNTLGINLDKVGKEFKDLGLGVSESQAKATEAFNDSQTKLQAVFSSVKKNILAELAPAMKKLTERTLSWVKEMGGAEAVAKKIVPFIVSGFEKVQKVVELGKMSFKGWKMIIKEVQAVAKTFFEFFFRHLDDIKSAIESIINAISKAIEKLDRIRQSATTSTLDLVPSLQVNPNATAPNAPAAIAARRDRKLAQQREIAVRIIPDKDKMVDAVVEDKEYRRSIDRAAQRIMENSARSTRR